jgi:hypothetical protein
MDQNPSWKADRSSVGQQIPRILQNPKVHFSIQKRQPPVPTLSRITPTHTPIPLLEGPFLILSSNLRLVLPAVAFMRSAHQNTLSTSPASHNRCTPRPSYFYHKNNNNMKVYNSVQNMYHSIIMKTTIIVIYCDHICVHVKTIGVIIQLLFIV